MLSKRHAKSPSTTLLGLQALMGIGSEVQPMVR
jgi:hypothetical protein